MGRQNQAHPIPDLANPGHLMTAGESNVDDIDTNNDCLVGARGGRIVMMAPPYAPMSKERALRLAAWLVVIADPGGEKFAKVLAAVKST